MKKEIEFLYYSGNYTREEASKEAIFKLAEAIDIINEFKQDKPHIQ